MTRRIIGGLAIALAVAVTIFAGMQPMPADTAAKNKRVPARALPTASLSR
jgi:hypothetical protein